MDDFYREETHRTPEIKGAFNEGNVSIIGRSLPEDAKDFFLPLRDWLHELYLSEISTINFMLELEYFNTATSKIIIDMLINLEKLKDQKEVSVIWAYDADDVEMLETGEDFAALLGDMVILQEKPFNG